MRFYRTVLTISGSLALGGRLLLLPSITEHIALSLRAIFDGFCIDLSVYYTSTISEHEPLFSQLRSVTLAGRAFKVKLIDILTAYEF